MGIWGARVLQQLLHPSPRAIGATKEDAQGLPLGSVMQHGHHRSIWVPFPWGGEEDSEAWRGAARQLGVTPGALREQSRSEWVAAETAPSRREGVGRSGGIGGEREGDAGSGRGRGRQGDRSPVSQPGGVL